MRKYLNTLVAIVILGALWGGFTYYGKHKAKETPKSESKEEKILPIDPSHVQSFTLKPRDGETFTCNRGNDGQWAIAEPQKLPADQSAVNSLLSTLTSATVDEVASAHPSNLKDFGLAEPSETLEVTTNTQPAKFGLLLGDDTPTSGGVYAQVAGNPRVVTLASYLKSSLEKQVFDLRDKRAVTLNLDQLKQIEVKSKKSSYTLQKNPEGVWDLVLPPPVRADHFTVDGVISQLRDLSMRSITSEDKAQKAKYGLSSPALTVKLSGPATTQSILFGDKEKTGGKTYATNSALAPIFTLDSGVVSQLEKQPADLRDKDLFSFSQFDAKRIDVSTPAGHHVLELQGKDWKQTAPAAKTLSRGAMDDLLSDLRDLRAASFPSGVSLAAAGLDKPAYRFDVRFGEKNQEEVVEVSKVKDHLYARRSNDPLPCELAPGALDSIDKALAKL
jgi:Domain of unknown function (DUF4340)